MRIIIKKRRAQRQEPAKPEPTEEQKSKSRKEYMRNYYYTHREQAQAYQREYNAKHNRKKRIDRDTQRRKRVYLKGGLPKQERAEIIDVYNPSSLMNLQPEKLEKAVNRILGGVCDYVGAR